MEIGQRGTCEVEIFKSEMPRALEVVGEENGTALDAELLLNGFSLDLFFFPLRTLTLP